MAKLWKGVTDGVTDPLADGFNSSISFDCRMYAQDIRGSIAHARMLADCGIITGADREAITLGLGEILADLVSGRLAFDPKAEDIHMFIEEELTSRIGDAGKKLHTARSRNDQVALDLRLWLKDETARIGGLLKKLIEALTDRAEENTGTIMPGYTHLQRAQPVSFAHHLLAYASMFLRDAGRLADCEKRADVSPIGSCALAGTGYPTDRVAEAGLLGFSSVSINSIDGVSDRDFAAEALFDLSLIMTHLSRLSEEIVLWSSWEFRFIELSDDYTTGSSIMPQKKNPDMAELIRGKTGRVYGDLIGLLTVLKGLPLAYNKDMQEDKESVFDACDTVSACLGVMIPMVKTLTVKAENMRKAAGEGFINATDLADYLTAKGIPFRDAYRIAGSVVAICAAEGKTLETLPLDRYRSVCDLIREDVYEAVDLDACLARRKSFGGTSPDAVAEQIRSVRAETEKITII